MLVKRVECLRLCFLVPNSSEGPLAIVHHGMGILDVGSSWSGRGAAHVGSYL